MTSTHDRNLPLLEVRELCKSFPSSTGRFVAIGGVSFAAAKGEIVCIVGPSGCGKTTLLRCLSGLTAPSGGRVRLQGDDVLSPPEGLAVVFQDYSRSLLPWMTVEGNVALPLNGRRPAQAVGRTVRESLEAVELSDAAKKYPWQLSGGMQQRVAIARALACQPRVLLMDEPFASVDAQTRADLEDLALQVRSRFGVTMVVVTHDIDEAVYLADRVIVLSSSPAHVLRELQVELPAPRDQIRTKEHPDFLRLRTSLYQLVKTPGPSLVKTEPTAGLHVGDGDD